MMGWDRTFQTPRISLLQPGLRAVELDKGPERSAERLVLDAYGNVVRLWADSHPEIPGGRLDGKFEVTSAERQPVCELVVQTQIIRRRIEQRQEPASRTTADERPLPTGTPLRIVPVEDVDFPVKETTRTHRLPGGETIRPCGPCGAEGHLSCGLCAQTGRVACSSCGGAKRSVCTSCNGAGRQRLVNGMIVNCGSCLATGFRTCTTCGPDGQVVCSRCSGEGFTTCSLCAGYGRICTYHVIVSEVSTEKSRVTHRPEPWDVNVDDLCTDMEPLWAEDVPLNLPANGQPAVFDVDAYSPDVSAGVLAHVRPAIAAALSLGTVEGATAKTARAVRLQLRGCYLHRVAFRLDGGKAESQIYIGGMRNRLAPGSLYPLCKTSTAWVQRPFHWLMRSIGIRETQGPSSAFRKRLQKTDGLVHMLDARAVVAEAVEALHFGLQVLDEGYGLHNDGERLAIIDLTHDESRGQLIVNLACPLGQAVRNRFVDALCFNGTIAFGRVGLVTDPSSGALGFTLFDVRPYGELDTGTYRVVLDYLLNTVRPNAIQKLIE